MKQMLVFHLTDSIQQAEIIDDNREIAFDIQRIFLVTRSIEESPVWKAFTFRPRVSKMYKGSEGAYTVHHYYTVDEINLEKELLNDPYEIKEIHEQS